MFSSNMSLIAAEVPSAHYYYYALQLPSIPLSLASRSLVLVGVSFSSYAFYATASVQSKLTSVN